EMLRRHRLAAVPPDGSLGVRVTDDELVLGRTPRMLAGHGTQGAIGGQIGFTATDRLFVQLGFGEVVIDPRHVAEADGCYPIGRIIKPELLHTCFLRLDVDMPPQLAAENGKSKAPFWNN